MKKIVLISLLLAAAVAFAQNTDNHAREHRGFYSSIDAGFSYMRINQKTNDYYSKQDLYGYTANEIEKDEFSGFGFPMMEFKFGFSTLNMLAFYTVFNFSGYVGTLDREEYTLRKSYTRDEDYNYIYSDTWDTVEDYDSDSLETIGLKTYIGFGTAVYPFTDKESAMNGFFVGGSVGYTLYLTGEGEPFNVGTGFQAEIGKDWWIGSDYSIGVSFIYGRTSPAIHDVSDNSYADSFSIMFRLTRG